MTYRIGDVSPWDLDALLANRGVGNGLPFKSLTPTGQDDILQRNVAYRFCDGNGHWLAFNSGAATLTSDQTIPLASAAGQTVGAKLTLAGTVSGQGLVRSFAFVASASDVPTTQGCKPFVKAAGQVLYAMVYVDGDAYQANTAYSDTVSVRFLKDTSNYYEYFFPTGSFWLKAGWNMLPMRWDASESSYERVPTKTGTVNDGDTITLVAVGLQAGSTASTTIYIGEVGYFTAPPGKPTMLLTFDGNYAEHQTRALPLLQAQGVSATFTTGAGYWHNSATMPLALVAGGMEVGQQVYRHVDYPQQGDAVYTKEVDWAVQYMRGINGLDYRIQSMPYNDVTKSQVSIAGGKGVRLIREARVPVSLVALFGLGHGAVNGAMAIGCFGLDNITRTQMLKYVDAAVRYGSTVALCGHQLVTGSNGTNTTGNSIQTFEEDLDALITYGKAQGVQFLGMAEWVRSHDVSVIKAYPA